MGIKSIQGNNGLSFPKFDQNYKPKGSRSSMNLKHKIHEKITPTQHSQIAPNQ